MISQPTPLPSPNTLSADNAKNVIEIWKKVIDVQQHFNDLGLRIRNYALTLFTAIVAGIGILEKEKIHVSIFNQSWPASFLLSLIGLFVMFGFYYMDRFWYHRLLVGAVKQGLKIEQNYATQLPELALTTSIGKESPHNVFGWKIHSKHKFYIFYFFIFASLAILALGLWNFSKNNSKVTSMSTDHSKPLISTEKRDTIMLISVPFDR